MARDVAQAHLKAEKDLFLHAEIVESHEETKDPSRIVLKKPSDQVSIHQLSATSFQLRCNHLNQQSTLRSFTQAKDTTTGHIFEIERLLLLLDRKMHFERLNLVNLLKYVGGGIDNRENHIKELLAKIAILEMEKSKEEDQLSEQTLRTIEIVNIDDIKSEMA
jgi:hypothetical protein